MTSKILCSWVGVAMLILFDILVGGHHAVFAAKKIDWEVVASGGNESGTSSGYQISGTVGQAAVGFGTSGSYQIGSGFWQPTDSTACSLCGDADASGLFSISDAVFLITYIFGGGPAPYPLCRGDADGNDLISISDAVYLIDYIFDGGPAPHC